MSMSAVHGHGLEFPHKTQTLNPKNLDPEPQKPT